MQARFRRGSSAPTALANLLAVLLAIAPSVFAEPEIVIDPHGVLVTGLEASDGDDRDLTRRQGREILHIVAFDPSRLSSSTNEKSDDLPPLLGAFRVEGGGLRFEPRFPPAPGLVLDIRFDGAAWDRLVGRQTGEPTGRAARRWRVPDPEEIEAARVLEVMPSGQVPENLLRFYVHFSAPMSARHVLEHVELIDQDGSPVPVAFVDVPGGLWDPERRRLTLFVHPGRVKRGVGPNQTLGPVLEEGRRFTLRVNAKARDSFGRALAEPFEAQLDVGAPDRRSPDPSAWRLVLPATPDAPLLVELDEPADSALLARMLSVSTADGGAVEAAVEVSDGGRHIRFVPREPWPAGPHRLIVDSALEDWAGNRVDRLFEEASAAHGANSEVALDFELSFLRGDPARD